MMILVSSFAAAKAGPRLSLMNAACCVADMNMLGLLSGFSGSFWIVMASIRMPLAFMAWIYFTKYFAQASWNFELRLAPRVSLVVFIQVGADQDEPMSLMAGLILRISLSTGTTSARSGPRSNFF